MPPPSLAEVDAICRGADPVVRNRDITRAYHGLSAGLAARAGGAANWCTFATWASRQAGQTIRGEDLARAIEAELAGAEDIGTALVRAGDLLRAVGHIADRSILVATVRDVASPVRAAERASEAVARGNLEVFDEIGRPFARFLAALAEGGDAVARVAAGLRPGPSPDGQDLLIAAFAGYGRVIAATDARARAEQMLLANLRIGLHEQTRLQPEIVRALDAPIADRREVKTRLLERLFGDARAAGLAHRLAEHDGPLDDALQDLMDAVRGRLRQVVTAHLMTLDLPGGRVRLGADVVGVCPPSLLRPQDADLRALLTRIDPGPDGTAGSGAREWANLGQRMHFITELFRTRQEDVSLLQPPAELAAG